MFVNGSGRNKLSLQRTCHRYFLPSFGSFGKAVSEKKIFKYQPIRHKNCLWRPCLLTDQNEMSNHYRETSMDASYQVSIHLAMRFQRRRFKKKSTNQKQELSVVAMFVNGSALNEQFLQRTFQGCFLPSCNSFGQVVSEENIFLEINQSETRGSGEPVSLT